MKTGYFLRLFWSKTDNNSTNFIDYKFKFRKSTSIKLFENVVANSENRLIYFIIQFAVISYSI